MVFWQGIFIVMGCLVAGLLVGLLIICLKRRKKSNEYSLLDNDANFINNPGSKVPVATTVRDDANKLNTHEDPLEALIKSHKKSITAESPKQPKVFDVPVNKSITARENSALTAKGEKPAQPVALNVPGNVATDVQKSPPPAVKEEKTAQTAITNVPGNVVTATQKNLTITAKEEKPTQPVIHWTELYTSSAQVEKDEKQKHLGASVLKEPIPINQNGSEPERKPEKTETTEIISKSEYIGKKAAITEGKHKRVAKSSGPGKSENVRHKSTPEVKDKDTDTKPLVPESANNMQKIEPSGIKPEGALKSELVMEMEANLVIASKPWADKLYAFQTKCWDSKHGESDLFLNTHYQDMIQLYVDIGLANNIVWLATEINHRSKELDESYIKLCSNIAANIKKTLG